LLSTTCRSTRRSLIRHLCGGSFFGALRGVVTPTPGQRQSLHGRTSLRGGMTI
jgi:hypothetical protein